MEITLEPVKALRDLWNILLYPKAFLKKDQQDTELSEIFTYHVFSTLLGFIVATIFYYALVPLLYKLFPTPYLEELLPSSFFENLSYMVFSFFLALAFAFFWSLLFMGWVKLFKGDITFLESYRTIIYGRTAFYLFRWIPVLHILAMLQSILLIYLSLRNTYNFKKSKAVFTVVSGVGLIMLFAYLIVISYQSS